VAQETAPGIGSLLPPGYPTTKAWWSEADDVVHPENRHMGIAQPEASGDAVPEASDNAGPEGSSSDDALAECSDDVMYPKDS
jgi:hypothetical protein